MDESADSQLAWMYSFYEGVFRKGPGSEASTLKALSMLDALPPNPRIVDFGCGSGVASLILAKSMDGTVTAVDTHQPFLDELQAIVARQGLTGRVSTVRADMAHPPFPDHSFDLIWSEGAIYNIGFEDGLRRWRRLLATGGYFAVTEVTWLTPNPLPKAVKFWQTEYPAMATIDDNLGKVRSAGFTAVGHFVLPARDWENYYGPLEEHLAAFRSRHSTSKEAQSLADNVRHEIDVWRECGSSYGYVFYLGKAN
ncbi:MAG: class I SAM-dependent methyltransferase [Pirellulaceae bacterium]